MQHHTDCADVTLIGLCSTDGLYYASGALDLPGAMFTASHNPAEYNGIKLCRSHAQPIGARDLIVVQAVAILMVAATVVASFLTDVAQALLDPRLRRRA